MKYAHKLKKTSQTQNEFNQSILKKKKMYESCEHAQLCLQYTRGETIRVA